MAPVSAPAPARGRPPGSTGHRLLEVARGVFLENGFAGTTMDEIAARARISKASLYREHPSKSALYAAVVSDWAEAGRDAMRPALDRVLTGTDIAAGLTELGETIRRGVLSPEVLAMRRLVTSEAEHHRDVAAAYFSESWDRNIENLSDLLRLLVRDERLRIDDTRRAADEFTWLILGAPLNEALLTGAATRNTPSVDSAVRLFLTAYLPEGRHA